MDKNERDFDESLEEVEPDASFLDDLENRIEELELKLEGTEQGWHALNERIEDLEDGRTHYLTTAYGVGMSLAMVLSWSRNASIAWCLGHGLLSWGYVIWFAFTR